MFGDVLNSMKKNMELCLEEDLSGINHSPDIEKVINQNLKIGLYL